MTQVRHPIYSMYDSPLKFFSQISGILAKQLKSLYYLFKVLLGLFVPFRWGGVWCYTFAFRDGAPGQGGR